MKPLVELLVFCLVIGLGIALIVAPVLLVAWVFSNPGPKTAAGEVFEIGIACVAVLFFAKWVLKDEKP